VSAKGESPTGRARGRRGYTVARPRSNTWLWILNAIVISVVVIAAAAASTSVGHIVASALNHFLLFYAGVLALVTLTAEVGIGLVASDRIIMKPSARVTAQAIHRAMGFGAIAFLVIHIALEIVAGRSHPYDAVIPFLDKGKTFYLGLGTVASDMLIVIMMTGIYRARLATSMSPKAWRVIHASAYIAWIFGLVHGLLGGRAAKTFFGYSGFVYWAYGACAAAVAVALVMRLAAQHRASNEHRSQPVSDAPTGAGWPAAALATGALPSTVMSATAIGSGAQTALEGRPAAARRAPGLGQRGRPQLALPAGTSGQPSGSVPAAQYTGAGQDGHTRQYSRTGPFDQLGGGHPSGPMPQFGADHPSGPFDPPQFDGPRYERTGESDQSGRQHRHMAHGQPDWIAAYERPLGARRPVRPADHPSASFDRPVLPADHPSASFDQAQFDRPQFDQPPPAPSPRYELAGGIDRSALYQPILPADHLSAPFRRPQFDEPAGYDPRDRAAVPYQQAAVPYQQPVPSGRYAQPAPPDPRDAYAQYAQHAPPPQAGWPGQHRVGPDDPAAGYDPWERPGQFERPYDRGPSTPYGHPAQPGPSAGHYDALDLAAHKYEQRPQPHPRDRYAQYADPASQYGQPAYADPRDQAGPYRPAGDCGPPGHYARPAGWAQRAPYDQAAHADRSAQFERDRAAHHASFADQDASYTRPRPPGARDHFGPQDDTEPLNIVPLNTGDYS
jgi:DMSO/TMAO reductase YedYZ heme-binding membrane subunit